jgi:membrane protease YdiL (CAAX protease family)
MRRGFFGILWLAVFVAAGAVLGAHIHHGFARPAGAVAGGVLFAGALWWNWLPGLRRRRALRWGIAQVFWLIGGFIAAQIAGNLFYESGLPKLISLVTGAPAPKLGLVGGALVGYLAASLFSLWYIGRLGPARLRDGSPTGIAWRAAPKRAYLTAILLACGIIVLVIMIVHVAPPDLTKLKAMPSAKLFDSPGPAGFLLLLLAVFIAPPVEEYVFRGGIFAALASRVSPLWAGVITTLLFMAVHAPEKMYYPPGFIDVGLMAAAAAWMRVRFGSIRPGILLHIAYNGGLMLAAGLAG